MSDKPSITPSSESHQWSDLHHQIQDWLAGYADGELDEHHISWKLLGCRCGHRAYWLWRHRAMCHPSTSQR